MIDGRLNHLEELLSMLREQLYSLEKAKVTSPLEERVRIEQRIKTEIKPEIQKYEKEYWEILACQANFLQIEESEAEAANQEIIQQVNQIETYEASKYPQNIIALLEEIRDTLSRPGNPASAKLKGVISSFPPFLGLAYEAELDTEKFFQKHFPTFIRAIEAAKKKLPR